MSCPVLIVPRRFEDERGWFSEVWNAATFAAAGIDAAFVQDNQSLSRRVGTVRGIHFQHPPFAQAKLVRVLKGRILDVVVDLRAGSPTYGRWLTVELGAERGEQIFVPAGYGHGFVTREPDTEVLYKVDARYDRPSDAGIRWDDPAIGVDWGIGAAEAVLSEKDRGLPLLADFVSPFAYDGVPMDLVRAG